MKSEYHWNIYKFFHDPPGTPKEIKCIGCKVGAGCTCVVASGILAALTVKKIKANLYFGTVLGFLTLSSLAAGALSFKLASDDHKYNQRLVANHKEYLSKTRIENSVNNKNVN